MSKATPPLFKNFSQRKSNALPNKNWLYFPASILLFLVLWQSLSWIVASDLFPSPIAVAQTIIQKTLYGDLIKDVSITLARVAAAFFFAMAIGCFIGVLLGLKKRSDLFFDSWLIIALNLPALVIIVLCYIWFGLTEVAAITAVAINKIPLVAVIMREGTRALDPKLTEMSQLYKYSKTRVLRDLISPQLAPYAAAAARTGLALIWKIVLVVELLGRPNGIGFQIQLNFQLFDITAILAYAFAFLIVIQVIEALIIKPWERYANRWRAS
ncbi:ABC transporter permease subunit [Sneathiella marina]|uniref:ABC transporter permease subunit n=1 Tax=Sneathiella marina TaxID=2950108 RepID=A0ABY4W2G9_9PROT|nr:ABC transporter permease subunit [Sneathiella marina]USG60308.1 ABC transporter permease subunit [Sneathiella marina]